MNCSLSRAHKIVERITRQIDMNAGSARDMAAPITVHVPEAASEALSVKDQVQALLDTNIALYGALKVVRSIISATNESIGIGGLLTRKSILIRQKRQNDDLISYIRSTSVHAIDQEHAGSYFNQMSKAGEMKSVKVAVLGKKSVEDLELSSKEIQRQLDALSDDINALNAKTEVEITLEDEVWQLFS